EVNRSPQPPRQKAGDVNAEDAGHSGASADDRELTKSRKRERLLPLPANGGDDVLRAVAALTQSVLCRRRLGFTGFSIRNRGAVAHRPDSGEPGHLQSFIDYDTISLLLEWQS